MSCKFFASAGDRFSSNSSFMRGEHQPLLSIGSKRQAGEDVFFGEVWKVPQYFFLAHAGSEVVQDVVDGDSQTPDARLA